MSSNALYSKTSQNAFRAASSENKRSVPTKPFWNFWHVISVSDKCHATEQSAIRVLNRSLALFHIIAFHSIVSYCDILRSSASLATSYSLVENTKTYPKTEKKTSSAFFFQPINSELKFSSELLLQSIVTSNKKIRPHHMSVKTCLHQNIIPRPKNTRDIPESALWFFSYSPVQEDDSIHNDFWNKQSL